MKERKYNWIDSSDVFTNSWSRISKHLFIPTISGIIGAIILTYLISKYFPSEALNTIYFTGLWESFWAEAAGKVSYVNSLTGNEVLTSEAMNFFTKKVLDNIIYLSFIFFSLFVLIGGLVFYLKIKLSVAHSEKYLEDQHLKGTNIIKEKDLTKLQEEKKVIGAIVGNTAKLDEKLEAQHTFISGSSGTGKTVLLNQLYKWYKKFRPNGRWIVHDTKGDWIEKFYDHETDYIFNFSDARSLNFNVFSVIKVIPDIKSVIATIIPRLADEKDPVWTDTARDILEGCFLYAIKYDKKSNLEIKNLIKLSPENLAKKLKNVEGAEVAYGHLTSSESQAGNFMSNFRSKAGFFTSLPDSLDGKELDLEEWLENKEGGQSTIFLLNDTKNKELNAIRISVFVDSFIKTFLSMTESKTRKVYFFLDEIGSLSKIPSIVDGLALLRSFGGIFIIGIQEIQRLYSIYGKDLTATIVNNTATKVILRAQETETQEFCSKQIGEGKVKSTTLTNSTGAEINANREGTSFATTEKIEKAILPSEIGDMENNTYYFKNGSYPWTFIKKEFTDEDTYEKINKAFIQRDDMNISNLFKKSTNPEETSDEDDSSAPKGGGQNLEDSKIPETNNDVPVEEKNDTNTSNEEEVPVKKETEQSIGW